MSFLQLLIEALQSLTSNKMRSLLTILGIVIGVAAVIAMVSLGRGVQASVSQQFSNIGSTTLTIMYSPDPSIRNPQPLSTGDLTALSNPENVKGVQQAAGSISGNVTASYGSKALTGSVYGVTSNYASVNTTKVQEGRFLNEEDVLGQTAVVVLGPRAAEKLFDRTRGIAGEIIRLDGQPYRIVGLLASKGGTDLGIGGGDSSIYMPISTAQARLIPRANRTWIDQITVQIAHVEDVDGATESIKQTLRTRHQTPIGKDDFYIFSPKQLLDSLNQITGVLTIFLGGIAAISLLVGGIGIMNIMLVSVTERTREIGLRKALGARKRDILMQFLTESAVLSLTGGLIGIVLGWLIGLAISMAASASGNAFQVKVGLDAILLATLFSSAIGIFFGFYPANRAASLTPVEALRAE